MRIEGRDIGVQRTEGARPAKGAAPATGAAKPGAKSQVSLSAVGQSLGDVGNAPSIHPEKVAALKQQVQSGTYSVDAGKLADCINDVLP